MLVVSRFVQGMGGAMMSPVGRLVVLRTVDRSELVRAMAWVTVPALIGPVIGPPVGGAITTFASWRWIFWINVPIGLLGIVMARRFIPDVTAQHQRRFDALGFLLCGIALAALMAGLETAGRGIVPAWVSLAFAAMGALVFAAYVLYARRAEAPILDLTLLRLPTFRVTIGGGFIFRAAIGGLPFLLPLLMQLGFGLSAFASGLITFCSAAGALLMKLTAAPILDRFGFRTVLVWNAAIGGAALAACAFFRPGVPQAIIMAVLLAGGFFRSLQFTAINTLCYADVPDDRISRATSFVSMVQQIAVTFGVVVAAMLLHVSVEMHGGGAVEIGDFPMPFLVTGTLAAASALVFLGLPGAAGEALRGARTRRVEHKV
jgi:MFS family permease